jgi:hypothetical protein
MSVGYPETAMPVDIFKQLGITDYVIPFLLVFAAMYGILTKLKIVSDRADINGLLSFTVAFLVVMAGAGYWINSILPLLIMVFLLFFIGYLLFLFLGAPQESVLTAIRHPVTLLFIGGLIALFALIGVQDWLVFMDRIPAWMVDEQGELTVEDRFQGDYPGNVTDIEGKPSSIIVEGVEYQLIEGIYYKGGYQGVAYALGTPEVVGAILIFVILLIVTVAITIPT